MTLWREGLLAKKVLEGKTKIIIYFKFVKFGKLKRKRL